MPEVTCDECGERLRAEGAQQLGPGPPPLTTDLDCPCGVRWTALSDGTKWRRATGPPEGHRR